MRKDDVLDVMPDGMREKYPYPKASMRKRLANFIIDRILDYGLAGLAGVAIAIILVYLESDLISIFDEGEDDVLTSTIGDYIIGALLTIGYYTLSEYCFRGKTLGKLITRTRAIHVEGGELTLRDALMRSLSRIVPFEPFSFLSDDARSGWHDSWTDTQVVDETKPLEADW